ncbi:MAG: nuclear transport factor 2 family protein [Phycisphaerae bacterium]|nr:nuclear transport factor 2 family protein [Tepidisphaeraceae bacterium]
MTDWLFDTPWWLLAGLAVAAIALFVAGNNRQDAALKRLAAAALGLAVVLFAVSYFVDTPKEVVAKRTRELVSVVEKKEWDAFGRMLRPDAHLRHLGKQSLIDFAKDKSNRYNVRDARVTSMDVRSTGDTIIAVFDVDATVEVHGAGGSPKTTWQVTWVKTDNQWLIQAIDALNIPFMDLGTLLSGWK